MLNFKLPAITLSAMLVFAAGCADKEPPKEQAGEKGSQAPAGDAKAEGDKAGAKTGDGVKESDIPAGNKSGTLNEKGQVNEKAGKDSASKGSAASADSEIDPSSIEDIYFDYDQSDLRAESRDTLKKVAAVLKKSKDATLTIEGHCDARGTEEYNQALGQRRADAARSYLVNLGVARKRISTVSFGESQANQNADGEAAWQKDRRGAFVFKTGN